MSQCPQPPHAGPPSTHDVNDMEAEDVAQIKSKSVILVVDDEPSILSALTRLLRRSRYTVLTAQCSDAALSVLASTPVDLLVSDMRMPQVDGADLLAQAQRLYPDTMRILLTGYS